MGILGFGKAKKLEDLKVTDLRKERLVQEVQQIGDSLPRY